MKLPNIVIAPVHRLHLQILNQDINFVPFTVAQEKGYLSAIADKNMGDIVNNYMFLAKACVQEELDWEHLSLIDFITIAISMRAKSQGETIQLEKKECEKCKKAFPFEINIEEAMCFDNKDVIKSIHQIDEKLSVELVPLNIDYLYQIEKLEDELDIKIETISHSISKIFFNEQIFTDLNTKEIKENCINNLSNFQIDGIIKKLSEMITLNLKFDITCPECDHTEGLSIANFLEFLS